MDAIAYTLPPATKPSYCDADIAKEIASCHAEDCKTRTDIAKVLRSYRELGYNSATLYEASYRLQKAAGLNK